jgi:hypothetical protein
MEVLTPDTMFNLLAEAKDYGKPLVLCDLTFARLVDDVLVPYEKNEAIFVDGYPLTRDKVVRLKIMRQKEGFRGEMSNLHRKLDSGDTASKKVFGDQYQTRLEAIFFQHGEDVTAQALKAFNSEIKPSLKNYLPKREELIRGAFKLFIETIAALNKTG